MLTASFSKNLLGAVIIAPSLLLGGAALADPQFTERLESPPALETLDVTAVSLPHAIAAVEAKIGGRVMNIRFDANGGKAVYDAVVVTPEEVDVAYVDARTGEVLDSSREKFSDQSLSRKQQRDLKSLAQATTPLSAAIATAEQLAGTPAINAGLATRLTATNDVLAYNVKVVKHGRVEGIAVDATTGEVIANPSALGLDDRDPSDFLAVAPQ